MSQITQLAETIQSDEQQYNSIESLNKLPTSAGLLLSGSRCKKTVEALLNSNDGPEVKSSYQREYSSVSENLAGFLGPLVELQIITRDEFRIILEYYTTHVAEQWQLTQLQKGETR